MGYPVFKSRTFRFACLILAFLLGMGALPLGGVRTAHATALIPLPIMVDNLPYVTDGFSADNVGAVGSNKLFWTTGTATTAIDGSDGVLRLVDETVPVGSGTAVRSNRIKLNGGFSTYFRFKMSRSDLLNPADGLCFIVYKADSAEIKTGTYGPGLGYAGIPHSVGIEFDIYQNYGVYDSVSYKDPSVRHVAIDINGDADHDPTTGADRTETPSYYKIDNNIYGNDINVWVDYDAENGDITVVWGTGATRTANSDNTLTRNIGDLLKDEEVFVGFSASTGGLMANHDIKRMYFDNEYVPGGLHPDDPSYVYVQAASTVGIVPDDASNPNSFDISLYDVNGNIMASQWVQIWIDGNDKGMFEIDETGVLHYPISEIAPTGEQHIIKAVDVSGGALNSKSFACSLKADTTDNNIGHALELTFPATPSYEAAITGVTYGGEPLQLGRDYTISSGKLTLLPSGGNPALRSVGESEVIIFANGYGNATVIQTILAAPESPASPNPVKPATGQPVPTMFHGMSLSANIPNRSGEVVTRRGFVYSALEKTPLIGKAGVETIDAGYGAGAFTATITGLIPGKTYYVRAFARAQSGTSYGEIMSITIPLGDGVADIPKTGEASASFPVLLLGMAATMLAIVGCYRKKQAK